MVEIEHIRKLKIETEEKIGKLLTDLEKNVGLEIIKIDVHGKFSYKQTKPTGEEEYYNNVGIKLDPTKLYDINILLERI